MITPSELKKKSVNLYKKFLKRWAADQRAEDDFFPVRIPANLSPEKKDIPATSAAIALLRKYSKEGAGVGYRVEFVERRDQNLGRNEFPIAIYLDSLVDLLAMSKAESDFAATKLVMNRVTSTLPQLKQWATNSVANLHLFADSIDGLLLVANYFVEHPWPNCYARQIPLEVDTKFVERHSRVLSQWLDVLLPSFAIDVTETHFARRYGLRDAEQHRAIRLLDSALTDELGVSFGEFSLPSWELNNLPVANCTVFVVENRLNLLTVPRWKRAIAIRGEGRAVTRLEKLSWLKNSPIYYWGDIDVDGFLILSSIRSLLPQTKSILMDLGTLNLHDQFHVSGNGSLATCPTNLTQSEAVVFARCAINNIRLEQEKIPQSYVDQFFSRIDP